MRRASAGVEIIILAWFLLGAPIALSQPQPDLLTHTEWVALLLEEIESIEPGMTRAELMRVFTTEGGISTRFEQTFVHQDCPYIKVDVNFEMDSEIPADSSNLRSDQDVIARISGPYLQWQRID